MPQGFEILEFDLETALRDELVRLFDRMSAAPLTPSTAANLPNAQGVYQLFHHNERVYVGKTDADAGLSRRLERHSTKIQGRRGLDPSRVMFKAVRIYVFTPMDLETQLIKYYKNIDGRKPTWNDSGFGSNDPGRQRDHTKYKSEHFDAQFPIRTDLPVEGLPAGVSIPISEVLEMVAKQVPCYMRFERRPGSTKWHDDLTGGYITLSKASNTLQGVLQDVADALGPNWQFTVLPGYVIGYREQKAYDHAQMVIRGR